MKRKQNKRGKPQKLHTKVGSVCTGPWSFLCLHPGIAVDSSMMVCCRPSVHPIIVNAIAQKHPDKNSLGNCVDRMLKVSQGYRHIPPTRDVSEMLSGTLQMGAQIVHLDPRMNVLNFSGRIWSFWPVKQVFSCNFTIDTIIMMTFYTDCGDCIDVLCCWVQHVSKYKAPLQLCLYLKYCTV